MSFVQIIELKSSKLDELRALNNEWRARRQGKTTVQQNLVCRDRDRENTYLMIVEFPSYDAAMENSRQPETNEFAERMAKLCDEPPTYRNLDVIERLEY
jgi:quinol monooxygenase YgiN